MRLVAGLRPDPLRELQRSPRLPSLAAIQEVVLLLRRRGRDREKNGKGEGRGGKGTRREQTIW